MSLSLSVAIDRYDRHFPFFDGTVAVPKDLNLKILQVGQTVTLRDGEFRHERMIRDGEFDVCEFSLSSYLMARDRGLPLIAVPVFPRRLFSAGLFYVRENSGIRTPRDLIGRRVGLNSFQTTLSVLARGDLKEEYGVPWEDIVWCVVNAEKLPFDVKKGVVIESLGHGADLGEAMAKGDIDAFVHPHPPASVINGRVPARRLFPNVQQEEFRYFHRNGYFPIMHVIVLRASLVDEHPEVPRLVMDLFDQAKRISHRYYDDPNWSHLAWGRKYYEEERSLVEGDIWPSGIRANSKNLQCFIDYMFDQNLISRRLTLDELFAPSILAT